MSEIMRSSDTCKVVQVSSNRSVEAVVQDFIEHEKLNVVLNKSVKLSMKWNGKQYEGRSAGMDFVSAGPAITRTRSNIRGM